MIARRSSGSLRRAGRGSSDSATAAVAVDFASSFDVLSGWLRLQPSS